MYWRIEDLLLIYKKFLFSIFSLILKKEEDKMKNNDIISQLMDLMNSSISYIKKLINGTSNQDTGSRQFNENQNSQAIQETEDVQTLLNLGNDYFLKENYSEAEKYYKLASEKGNTIALSNLGVLYYKQKNYYEAEKYYLKTIEIEQEDEPTLINLGILYEEQGKYEKAEKIFLKAIMINQKNGYTLNYLGFIYDKQGKLDEAEKYYILAIKEKEENAINNLEDLYKRQGKN